MFQSTPPVSGRRCLSDLIRYGSTWTVSIHAPRFREAMPREFLSMMSDVWFQSTPPVSGRRCPPLAKPNRPAQSFQSTPPVSGRRCKTAPTSTTCTPKFQSTPPVSGRRCLGKTTLNDDRFTIVSIHAPRFREAMRVAEIARAIEPMFQSTPPVSGRRCTGTVGARKTDC